MLRGGLPRATVYLCFVCLLAVTPLPAIRRCTQDTIANVESFINDPGLNRLDCRLYTPTIDHFKKCPSSTMKCFAAEIKVLIEEWETIPFRGFGLNGKLITLSKLLNQTDSECPQCELFQEETAEKFLANLLSTLQSINTVNCPRRNFKKRPISS